MFYLRNFYGENALAKGDWTLGGVKLDLSKVKTPVYVQSSKEDHIAPYRSVYRGARLFGGPVTFTMAGSGHIAGVINAPVAKKYQHWTNDTCPAPSRVDGRRAVEHPGSWWPHWRPGWQEQVRRPGPGPRSRQGQAEAARGRAWQLRAGALGHLIVDHDDRRTMFAQNSPGLRWSFPPCSRSAAARPWE
jgi:poly(3-hydroxyalkanoate) synthetase